MTEDENLKKVFGFETKMHDPEDDLELLVSVDAWNDGVIYFLFTDEDEDEFSFAIELGDAIMLATTILTAINAVGKDKFRIMLEPLKP